ncbi:hypothetical protein EGM85_11955 [Macrococcus caseolyticus]|nr:hypothetical protein [Macrococcus caseolyticus]RKO10189.1 hypothetical protein D6861_11955 [Macrococcus caseolyticus]
MLCKTKSSSTLQQLGWARLRRHVKQQLTQALLNLWVFSTASGQPNSFDTSASSTYQLLNHDFSIRYVSGSAHGDWVKDNVTFGSDSVTSLQFAVINSPTQEGESAGVFGIGQEAQESSAEIGSTYVNFPAALEQEGVTKVNAYSLYLDSIEAKNGSSVLFGGVDTSKYTGTLWTIPFTSQVSFNVDFQVAGDQNNGVLDSGTSLTYLPESTLEKIASTYGATFNFQLKSYVLDGEEPSTNEPLVYTFSNGATVTVPTSELFIQDSQSGSTILMLLPTSMSQGITLLGDSFLRSAYVVYNLDANICGIAQANWSPGPSNIVEITGDTIPGSESNSQSSSGF